MELQLVSHDTKWKNPTLMEDHFLATPASNTTTTNHVEMKKTASNVVRTTLVIPVKSHQTETFAELVKSTVTVLALQNVHKGRSLVIAIYLVQCIEWKTNLIIKVKARRHLIRSR